MKKGFTLIELLAVIVILAIIMVIAVPQILNIIDNSRKEAANSSIELLKSGIKTQIAAAEIANNPFEKGQDGCYTFNFDEKNSNNYEKLLVKNKEKFTGEVKYCNGDIITNNLTFNESDNVNTEKVVYLYKNGTNNDINQRETSTTCDDTHYYHFNDNNLTINYVDQTRGCTGFAAIWTNTKYDLSKYSKAVVEYSSVNITDDGKFVLAVSDDYNVYSWLTSSSRNGKLELDLTNCNLTSAIDVVLTTKPEDTGFNYFQFWDIDRYIGNVDAVINSIYLVEK